jgi:hypothetical protein
MSPNLADSITQLTNKENWLEVGDSVDDIITAAQVTVEDYYNNMLIGTVFMWAVNPPPGWLLLDGSTYALSAYPELSALLPAHLVSTPNFTLPDVTESFCYGVSDEDDASIVTGSNTLNLTVGQLPAHSHLYTPPLVDIDVKTVGAPIPYGARMGTPTATSDTGDGDDIDKRPKMFGLICAIFAGRP